MTPKARRQRFQDLQQLGCVVCWREYGCQTPAEIHHLKGAQWSGMGKRASDEHTIPLCPAHHRTGAHDGTVGYHQSPSSFEARYGTQAELLEFVDEWIARRAA